MANKRHQPNPNKIRKDDLVIATEDFSGRITPPLGTYRGPSLRDIPFGTRGLVHGRASGAPDLFDVDFDVGGEFRRVEAHPHQITLDA
ncbi:MAG: hypothetical protein JWM39_517 [Parcubacteria group bacterium]|nr:hypothetical protein [Parcubacteria group bacterium]